VNSSGSGKIEPMTKRAAVDGTTVRPRSPTKTTAPTPAPYLTVLWHPSIDRVGEVAPLPEKLSRLEPEFGPPGGKRHAPLADPHLSRKPIALALTKRGLSITADAAAELFVDDVAVAGTLEIASDALARGAVLQLAGRVVLLAHMRLPPSAPPAGTLVGASDPIALLQAEIARVADLVAPVLVTGETGAGKEHVARAIHENGPRANKPFVAINMATLAPSVAATQLFGHARGAFTGAERAHAGLFEQADGGTLFLDEIADAPAEIQAMLLRTLETGEVQPVGAAGARKVDVRVVAATDSELDRAVERGEFRPQLFHRLAGYRIAVPPLRARIDALGRLLARFVQRELAAMGAAERLEPPPPGEPPWLPSAAIAAYARHDWPGNVRELANVARHLAVVGRHDPVELADALSPIPRSAPRASAERSVSDDELIAVLAAHQWKTGAAATALGISRTTLYALIDRCAKIRKARDLERDEIAACYEQTRGDLDAMSERLQVSKRGLQLRMRELGM